MFTKTILLGLSALTLAAAQIGESSVLRFTHVPNPVTDGKVSDILSTECITSNILTSSQAQAITYATNDTITPAKIVLRKGDAINLQNISTLTEFASAGQFIWTPPSDLPNGDDYALSIYQGTQTGYFGPFSIQGYSKSANSTTTSSNSTSSSSSSSSSRSSSNAAGMPTGFPFGGNALNSGAMKSNSTMSRNSTSSMSSATSTTASSSSSSSTIAPTTQQPSPSARPSGSAADTLHLGGGMMVALGALAAALL